MSRPRSGGAVTGQLELPVDGPWCQHWRHPSTPRRHRSTGGVNPLLYRVQSRYRGRRR